MALDTETVKHVARLSRLKINQDEIETVKNNLNGIFDFIGQLQEVNTEDAQPMVTSDQKGMPMREDVITDGNCVDKILANAPEKAENMFVVPKVVE